MSTRKFAEITSALLVRKGEAAPSMMSDEPLWGAAPADTMSSFFAGSSLLVKGAATHGAHDWPAHPNHKPDEPGAREQLDPKPRRIVLMLSTLEYEALGIAAVKKNTTRHLLAQHALNLYFIALAAELGNACACVTRTEQALTACACAPSPTD